MTTSSGCVRGSASVCGEAATWCGDHDVTTCATRQLRRSHATVGCTPDAKTVSSRLLCYI
jgi:hypothetical protein